jgi:glucosamine--fructose-6-phosphate aminotransferase (isomerizing)
MLKEIFEQPEAVRDTCAAGSTSKNAATARLERLEPHRRTTSADLPHRARLRHELARGAHRQVLDRGAGADPGRGRLRLRVPLPRSGRRRPPTDARRRHLASRARRSTPGRDGGGEGRNARRSALCQRARISRRSRASRTALYTHAGPEIGVASTKAFTTQLVALAPARDLRSAGRSDAARKTEARRDHRAARRCRIRSREALLARRRARGARRAVPRGARLPLPRPRGFATPVALEGALKLKEISYIHAEGYPAGEMKHGPIALIDETCPSSSSRRAARSTTRRRATSRRPAPAAPASSPW